MAKNGLNVTGVDFSESGIEKFLKLAQKFKLNHFGAVFFFNFLAKRVFNAVVKFQTAAADVPTAVFIAGVAVSLGHHKIALVVVAKIDNGHAGEINAFLDDF